MARVLRASVLEAAQGAGAPGGRHRPKEPWLLRLVGVAPGGGLAAGVESELVEDVGHVPLDGVGTELERPGDVLVAGARGDQVEDLRLARAQAQGDGLLRLPGGRTP